MNCIYQKEEINTKRQIPVDFAKATGIFFMIFNHVILFIGFNSDNFLGNIVSLLSVIFGACSFMVAMGIGISYKKADANALMKRGAIILLLGYIFNALFSIFPLFILSSYQGRAIQTNDLIFYLLNDDIMQFAGLALLLFGLLKKLKLKNVFIFAFALVLSLVALFVGPVGTTNPVLNQILGLFITTMGGSQSVSNFPLLEWFIFVPAGVLIGDFLKHIGDKTKLYLIVFFASLAVVLPYLIIGGINGIGLFSREGFNLIHLATYDALYLIVSSCLFLSISYFVSFKLKEIITSKVTWAAKNINAFYIISYFLIGVSKTVLTMCGVDLMGGLSIPWILLYFFLVLLFTTALVLLFDCLKKLIVNSKKEKANNA
ncbi:MAG: hypothetical protein MJ239_07435 [Bacilli bacterium]|nr:hypothetical protein [Bacilli bacterium]